MSAILALRSGIYGASPNDCPIGYDLPNNRREHIVPVEYRALLGLIVRARYELNRGQYSQHQYRYHDVSTMISEKAWELDSCLFRLVSDPSAVVIEYHSGWKFSVLTPEDIKKEYEASEAKNGRKSEEKLSGGPTLDYMKSQPPETWSQPEYIFGKQLSESSLEKYLKTCRDENKKRRGS